MSTHMLSTKINKIYFLNQWFVSQEKGRMIVTNGMGIGWIG